MPDPALIEQARRTARRLFRTVRGGVGDDTWRTLDPALARELSVFFAGRLYSRSVLSQRQRELCAVAALTVLARSNELYAHVHAALNVGATRREVAETIFQQVTYGGMPVVAEGLAVLRRVLEERGDWPARPTPRRDRSGAAAPRGRRRRRAKRAIRTAPPASRRA
jgi:4-carboxymuconolactone decarboxylase